MTDKSESAMAQTKADADLCGSVRPDIMAMCLRLLAMYMRRLHLDAEDEQPSPAEASARIGAGRKRAATPPAESCGARRRDGSPCPRPPVEGRRRCRSHGCAPRSGAPKGNRNALTHGRFTAKEMARGRRISEFIRECRETMRDVDRATRRSRMG
jgi:hypothetical protein